MAKDGTNRGGTRIGAGRKRQPLPENVEQESKKTPKPPKKYLSAEQKTGNKFLAKKIYAETWDWVFAHGGEKFVMPQLVENYAQTLARRIQCEEILSEFGLLAKHPTTGEPCPSPFVKMSNDYMKLASILWMQIYSIVKERAVSVELFDTDDEMELLLRRVK